MSYDTRLFTIAILAFLAGKVWTAWVYEDICLDLGGGRNPGNHPICVIER